MLFNDLLLQEDARTDRIQRGTHYRRLADAGHCSQGKAERGRDAQNTVLPVAIAT